MKESDIQKQVVSYLSTVAQRNNFFFFSVPNEGFMQSAMIMKMDSKTKAMMSTHLKKMGLISGVPDLCIIYNEKIEVHPYPSIYKYIQKTLFIELKTETGKLSEIQKHIHKAIKKVGHNVEIARSLDDVIEIISNYGVLK